MDTYNFLYELPSKSFLDFVCDRNSFDEFLETSKEKEKLELMENFLQTIFKKEELKQVMKSKVKGTAHQAIVIEDLYTYVSKLCASLGWDMRKISNGIAPLYMRDLIMKILRWTFPEMDEKGFICFSDYAKELCLRGKEVLNEKTIFMVWIIAQYILVVEENEKIQKPLIKQTVNNPERIYDPVLNFAEKNHNTIRELSKYIPNVLEIFNVFRKIVSESDDLDNIPLPTADCFIFNIGNCKLINNSENEFCSVSDTIISMRMSKESISKNEFLALIAFEECILFLSVLRKNVAVKRLEEVVYLMNMERLDKLWNVDSDRIKVYCQMLRVKLPDSLLNENIMEHENITLKSRIWKLNNNSKIELGSKIWNSNKNDNKGLPLKIGLATVTERKETLTLNIIKQCIHIMTNSNNDRTVKENACNFAVYKALHNRKIIKEIPSDGQEIIFRVAEIVKKEKEEEEKAKHYNVTLDGSDLKDYLCLPLIPYWNLITAFNPAAIKDIMMQFEKVLLSNKFKCSYMLQEMFLKNKLKAQHEYLYILMVKMQQLEAVGNDEGWQILMKNCHKEIEALNLLEGKNKSYYQRFLALDNLRGNMVSWNEKIFKVSKTEAWQNVTKSLAETASLVINHVVSFNSPIIVNHFLSTYCTFLLNTCSYKPITDIKKQDFFNSDIWRLSEAMAYYCIALAETKSRVSDRVNKASRNVYNALMVYFYQHPPQSSKHIKSNKNSPPSKINELIEFTKNLKEQGCIDLLIDFLVALVNDAYTKDRTMLNGYIPTEIFSNDIKIWQIFTYTKNAFKGFIKDEKGKIDINFPSLKILMQNIFKNALSVHPHNAFWIRMYGDFCLLIGDFRKAMRLYLQVILIGSENFKILIPENVVDDIIYIKMATCCYTLKYLDMTVMIAQSMKNPRMIIQNLQNIYSDFLTLDAGCDYYKFIFNDELFENMTKVFDRSLMVVNFKAITDAYSIPILNPYNPTNIREAENFRRNAAFWKCVCNVFFLIAE
uniref:RING-type domain-containing protein n=1 Tax=Strongyloides papillosus TaxID=174720 RepID=A0A0N5B9I6_STREA